MKKYILLIPTFLFCIGCNNSNVSSNSLGASNSNQTLTKWEVNFFYNYEGNNDVFITKEVEHGSKITELSETPSRVGYEFTNWYRDTYCKIEWDFKNDKVTAPTSLYAGWKISDKPIEDPIDTYNINWIEQEGVVYKPIEGSLPTKANLNEEISFTISILDGYIGTPVVTINNEVLLDNNGVYSFEVTSNIDVRVSGIEKEEIIDYYRITFTLPDFDPIAVNPRLYYWGSESTSDTLFNLGATSNMKQLEGSTYYIDLSTSITLEGIIMIFDQGSEVKQSFDITGDSLPKEAGVYHVNVPDWGPDGWKTNSFGVWCFVATLEKQ